MDAECDKDLLVVATASEGFLVMATYQSRFMPGGIEIRYQQCVQLSSS